MSGTGSAARSAVLGLLTAASLAAPAPAPALARAAPYRPPRTSDGRPDLQGVWTNLSLTRLERPKQASGLVVGPAEAARLERVIPVGGAPREADAIGQTDSEFPEATGLATIDGAIRTSWLTSPADGRLPYSPAGRAAYAAGQRAVFTAFDDPEARTASDRCLASGWSTAGPPMLNAPSAAYYEIVQTPGEVAILSENNGELRHIRLNATHDPSGRRQWMGDSVGRWEGDTLVVETVNLHPGEAFHAPLFYMSPDAKVTERFTRVSKTEIRYAFSVDDPKAFTEVWRGELPLRAAGGRIRESACHEGNYALPGILAGGRRAEADARKPR